MSSDESSYKQYLKENILTDSFGNHLLYLKNNIEMDSEEIEKQKKYCNTVINSCKKNFVEKKLKEKEEDTPASKVEKEDVFVNFVKSINSNSDTKVIISGILVFLVSLVMLICILAFFSV
jgi:hypothetical protein